MKTSIYRMPLLLFLVLSIISSSCRGPRGPQGDPGYDGLNGLNGRDANVSTIQFTIHPSSWIGDVNGYTASVTKAPEITQDIYNNGAVLLYKLNDAQSYFDAIPYTWIDGSSTEYLDANIYVGGFDLILRWTDNGVNSTDAPTADYVIKAVIIQGINVSQIPDAVKKNYQVAISYFNIK